MEALPFLQKWWHSFLQGKFLGTVDASGNTESVPPFVDAGTDPYSIDLWKALGPVVLVRRLAQIDGLRLEVPGMAYRQATCLVASLLEAATPSKLPVLQTVAFKAQTCAGYCFLCASSEFWDSARSTQRAARELSRRPDISREERTSECKTASK